MNNRTVTIVIAAIVIILAIAYFMVGSNPSGTTGTPASPPPATTTQPAAPAPTAPATP